MYPHGAGGDEHERDQPGYGSPTIGYCAVGHVATWKHCIGGPPDPATELHFDAQRKDRWQQSGGERVRPLTAASHLDEWEG
jgi:hypothetical protein